MQAARFRSGRRPGAALLPGLDKSGGKRQIVGRWVRNPIKGRSGPDSDFMWTEGELNLMKYQGGLK